MQSFFNCFNFFLHSIDETKTLWQKPKNSKNVQQQYLHFVRYEIFCDYKINIYYNINIHHNIYVYLVISKTLLKCYQYCIALLTFLTLQELNAKNISQPNLEYFFRENDKWLIKKGD